MSRLRIPRPFAAIAFAAAVACTTPTGVCACSPPEQPFTVLRGIVSTPAGAAVEGAMVSLQLATAACTTFETQPGNARSSATGEYEQHLPHSPLVPQMCVRLVAQAPAGSGFQASDPVQMVLPTPTRLPPDTVRVDLVLRTP